MFTNTEAFSGFAVDDLEAAKKFYGETLGIRTSEQYGLLTAHDTVAKNRRDGRTHGALPWPHGFHLTLKAFAFRSRRRARDRARR